MIPGSPVIGQLGAKPTAPGAAVPQQVVVVGSKVPRDKPLLVRGIDSAFDGMTSAMAPFVGRSQVSTAFLMAVAPQIVPIGPAYVVPNGMYLDISQLKSWAYIRGLAAIPQPIFMDSGVMEHGYFQILCNGVAPWDVTAVPPGVVLGASTPGWFWLNRNILSDWGSTPMHLLVPEGTSVTFQFVLYASYLAVPDSLVVGVQFNARLIPKTTMTAILERL